MKAYIEKRTLLVANYILDTGETIRKTAELFNISKSTVHYDLANRLKKINLELYEQVKKILDFNFEEKHIRGGESTRRKYILEKSK